MTESMVMASHWSLPGSHIPNYCGLVSILGTVVPLIVCEVVTVFAICFGNFLWLHNQISTVVYAIRIELTISNFPRVTS